MNIKDKIIQYLIKAYNPESILMYGSFVDGSNNENSDFDALIIADSTTKHDSTVIEGTTLDVFVYSPEIFQSDYSIEDFLQVFDGVIVLDKNGLVTKLKRSVELYLEEKQNKSEEEHRQDIDWCHKMIKRTLRKDCEGYYRWHLLLTESLQIYCDAKKIPWFGPKKAIQKMALIDSSGYQLYSLAVKEFTSESLIDWIAFIEKVE